MKASLTTWSIFLLLLLEDHLFRLLLKEDFWMLPVVITGAYYPLVVTTWKIFTTGTSYLTTGTLCNGRIYWSNLIEGDFNPF